MPALLVDTSLRPAPSPESSTARSEPRDRKRSRSRSPDRPPVSPITPTISVAQLAPVAPSEPRAPTAPPQVAAFNNPTFIQQPPSIPISESDNPDAIALRAAISSLQMQREQSMRDMKALEQLKHAAVADPQGFARMIEQRAKAATASSGTATDAVALSANDGETGYQDRDARKDSADVDGLARSSKFPEIPQPQSIHRCPTINWAKYQIVGESLDKLHEEQKQYPGYAEPPRARHGAKAPPHPIAAPYSPLTDVVGGAQQPPPPQAFRSVKKSH
ncbi:hypothetical protein BDV95DRAFT_608952 [Massariosphaeria phaeospora]|uniref:Uncharacterized protein n=1 Tax=Massariosphaeria phaeospora TaxID=100035 RepID=A0A7C8MBZ6_9PLEO|nr:hypothetical protein BDV95DRAFT_608952 [Massariosphaeria phaeospora]